MDGTETQELDAVPNDAVVDDDPAESSAESETTTSLFSLPQTEEEMRHCQHCEFQAEDWHVCKDSIFRFLYFSRFHTFSGGYPLSFDFIHINHLSENMMNQKRP